jgi:hypothetical protein
MQMNNNKLQIMWKEVVVDYFVVLPRHSSGGTGIPRETSVRIAGGPRPRFNPGFPKYEADISYSHIEFHVEIRKLVMKPMPLPEEGEHRH